MSSSPTRLFRRPSLESLEGRLVLSQGVTAAPPLLDAAAAEVRPAVLAAPASSQSLSAQASTYLGGDTKILSPIIPIILSDGRTSGATIWGKSAAGGLARNDPVAVPYTRPDFVGAPRLLYSFSLAQGSQVGQLTLDAVFVRSDGVQFHSRSLVTNYSPGNSFVLPLPPGVGQYTLRVRLTASNGSLDEVREHTVYVLLRAPLATATPAPRSPGGAPRIPVIRSELAIRYAALWATGQTTAAGVVAALYRSIYSNPLGWKYGSANTSAHPGAFLTTPGLEGDCYNYAELLSYMSALQGIWVGISSYRADFLVPADHPPLSGVNPDNRTPNALNLATNVRDAWRNGNHQLVVFAGKYFDPVHGFTGTYNPTDANGLRRSYGANLLGYLGEAVPNSPGAFYIMKNGRTIGICYFGDLQYRMFA